MGFLICLIGFSVCLIGKILSGGGYREKGESTGGGENLNKARFFRFSRHFKMTK